MTQSSTFDGPKVAPLVPASRLADRFLHVTLFVTTLSGILVFIEPSPYEASFALLLVACLAAGVALDRRMLPLVLLLVILNVGGALSLVPVADNRKAVTYLAISAYLSMTAVIYACLFARDSVRRVATLRTAYILAAVIVSILGAAGYFRLFPAAEQFIEYGRARGTFKDPNVFGPFLILPLMFIVQRALLDRLRMRHVIAASIILMGLFLSFSRGAWAHCVGSAVAMVLLLFLTAQSTSVRTRIVAFVVISGIAITGLIGVLLSFSAVRTMFAERASLTQSYDVEHGGRFNTQAAGLRALPQHPNGVGPGVFPKIFGLDPHNVYINTLFSYGWMGGIAYATLSLCTLFVGFRALWLRTPWQASLIAAYATYVGVFGEGFIIDTDHWRHYFLLLGLVWGLSVASERTRTSMPAAAAGGPPGKQSLVAAR